MKRKFVLCLIMLLTVCSLLFAACSSESKKIITLDKNRATANVFEIVTIDADTENITEQIKWSVSDATIATVENGKVSALKAGNVTVTASAEGISASAEITFTEVDKSELMIEVDAKNLSLYVGDSVSVNSYVKYKKDIIEGGQFSYSCNNSSVVTVSEFGIIDALDVGSANISVNCSIKGITLDEKTFSVSVSEGMELYSGAKGDNVTLYVYGGKNNEFPTSYTLSPILKVKNKAVSDATFMYSIAEGDSISLNNGVVTVQKCGSTFVNILCSYNGDNVSKRLLFNVIKPTIELMKDEEVVLGVKTKNDLSVLGVSDKNEIKKMKVGGALTEINVTGNEFTFSNSVSDGLSSQIIVETDELLYVLYADIYDYVVSTKDDFKEFGKSIKSDPTVSVALNSNIDYGMGNFFTDSEFSSTVYYRGLFNGRGYTVYNICGTNGLFYGLESATIKNVAFFNVLRNTWNGGGAVANEMIGKNLIENVYVQVKFTAYADAYLAGFANIGNGTFRNVILLADFASNPNVYNGWCRSYIEMPTLENCYLISANSNGKMYGDITDGVYTDVASFNKDKEIFMLSFNADCWDIINGTIMFKTMQSIVDSSYAMHTEIEITNSETVLDDDSLQLSASVTEYVSFGLKEEYAGLSVENGKLVVHDSCEQGVVIVVAMWQHPIYGLILTDEKSFTVNELRLIKLVNTVLVAKNRENADFSCDLSSYGLSSIESVKFNNTSIGYTFVSDVLKISRFDFDTATSLVKVITRSADGVKNIIYIPTEVVDYAIGTKDELKAFGTAIKTTPELVAVLTANIDYGMGNFFTDSEFNSTTYFKGVLDGKGYTICNIKANNGLFYGIQNGVIKNIGIKNLVRDTWNGGGSLANEMLGSNLIENVYVQVKFTAYAGDYLAGIASICEGHFKNVVLEVDFASNAGVYNAWGRSHNAGLAPMLENCYAISSNSNGKMYDEVTEGLYTTMADFIADSSELIKDFDSTYWIINDGKLTFKSCV